MPFIYLCGVIAFIIQMIVLHSCKRYILHFLSLVAMELFPACIAAHAVITQRPSGVLGWRFSVAISAWIAGASLSGCVLAWIVYAFNKMGGDDK